MTRWLVLVAICGCAHAPPPSGAPPSAPPRTAVGAYLENPAPYRIADLADCAFTGAVSADHRPTAPGPIVARCPSGPELRWTAVAPTAIRIEGPTRIPGAPTAQALYRVVFLAATTPIQGRAETRWTAPTCEELVVLHGFTDGTMVVPQRPGSCALDASVLGLSTRRTITIAE
jgi:hypothetical protein